MKLRTESIILCVVASALPLYFQNPSRYSNVTTLTTGRKQPIQVNAHDSSDQLWNEMIQYVHDKAYRPALNNSDDNRRKELQPFNITAWEHATNGGLQTKDRILLSALYHNATSVLEFGVGESTAIAAYARVPYYTGIDSDITWLQNVRTKYNLPSHYRLVLGDIGPTKKWGFPVDNSSSMEHVLSYQLTALTTEPRPFDLYTVDGRWRLPCVLASFLHASVLGASHDQTKVLLHDCGNSSTQHEKLFSYRVIYNRAYELLDLVDHSGSLLCVFQRKHNTTDQQLFDLWKQVATKVDRR